MTSAPYPWSGIFHHFKFSSHMKNWMLLVVLLLGATPLLAQHKIYGNITDETGSPLPGAIVRLIEKGGGTIADADGYYLYSPLETGDYTLRVEYLGYAPREQKVSLRGSQTVDFQLLPSTFTLEGVEVLSNWATRKTPVPHTYLDEDELELNNLGQDVPFLLRFTPSAVVTSDAGTGIGYTGIRIRGSDPSRINVTINGIPLNDSESQGVFWVDLPDFAGSTNEIQIQRGVGTSTNGSGAFGATINLRSIDLNKEAYADFYNSYGSFNSRKHSLRVGSGLIKDRWSFDGRLSLIQSDGYIDRGSADLRSFYLSGGWYGDKTTLKALAFTGHEITYQSWFGTPQSRLENDEEAMRAHAANNGHTEEQLENLLNSGRTYNFYLYDNQVDNYQQDHYQLHLSHQFSDQWMGRGALHYTRGQGFFEQFREDDGFADYQLSNPVIGGDTITSGDFIRRRWLDNDFYGGTASLHYFRDNLSLTLGGAFHQYDGDHFGEIIWAEYATNSDIRDRYYEGVGNKSDFNAFAKLEFNWRRWWNGYVDLQVRRVDYKIDGIDNDLRALDFEETYTFFNPKFGLRRDLSRGQSVFASVGVAHREPVRSDIVDALVDRVPTAERLIDFELGYDYTRSNFRLVANAYWMQYRDQLVQTGELNDVGAPVRINVPDSYRAGIELQTDWRIAKQLNWRANLTVSQNKIRSYDQLLYDYTSGFEIITENFEDTDIALSPNLIGASELGFYPVPAFEVALLSKYVGDQFLDNTSSEERMIEAFFVNDLRLRYQFKPQKLRELNLSFIINNVFDTEYSANGYTFSYVAGERVTENFFYPQAGIWWMAAVDVKF